MALLVQEVQASEGAVGSVNKCFSLSGRALLAAGGKSDDSSS